METHVKLVSLEIKNLKNVLNGKIEFPIEDGGFSETADIVGIYGQNGSGKTAVIDSLLLLSIIMRGYQLLGYYVDLINTESTSCSFVVKFAIEVESKRFYVTYSLEISRNEYSKNHIGISSEKLAIAKIFSDGKQGRTNTFFEYSKKNTKENPFEPKNMFDNIIKGDQKNLLDCLLSREIAIKDNTSFLFGKSFIDLLKKSLKEADDFVKILDAIKSYASDNFFVATNASSSLVSNSDIIPLTVKYKLKGSKLGTKVVPVKQGGPGSADIKGYKDIEQGIKSLSCVMSSLVPGLKIKVKNLGKKILDSGEEGIQYELVSQRNGKQIPFHCESDGIKKLFSIMNAIICAYNNASCCVAIDEFDSGVFELLLGDILRVFKEGGEGQLIFTSHNLRPLEVLDKKNIVFTTANPKNRYIFMKNIRPSNNLRDCYLRALGLGGQDEELMVEHDESEIRSAFRDAGEIYVKS